MQTLVTGEERKAQSVEGAVLWGQSLRGSQNSTFAQSTLLVRANLSFHFAHDRTLRNNTDEDLAKRNANEKDRSIFNVL